MTMSEQNAGAALAAQRKTETKKCANPKCDTVLTGLVGVTLCRRCYQAQYQRDRRAKLKQVTR